MHKMQNEQIVSLSRVQDESLRWLTANGKTEAAEKVMRKVARWNKIRYEDLNKIVMKRMTSNDNPNDVDTEKKEMTENTKDLKIVVEKYSIITILRSRTPEDLHSLIKDLSLFCEKRLHFRILKFT